MAAAQRTELEEARLRLGEGLLRLREQADHIDRLLRSGKSTEDANDVLRAMQATVDQMRQHLDYLVATTERTDRGH